MKRAFWPALLLSTLSASISTASYPVVSAPPPFTTTVIERPVYTTYSPVIVECPLPAQNAPPFYEVIRCYDQPLQSTSARIVTTVGETPIETVQVERRTFADTSSAIVRADEMIPLKADIPTVLETSNIENDVPMVLNRPAIPTEEAENTQNMDDGQLFRGQASEITAQLDRALALPPPAGKGPDPAEIPEVLTKTEMLPPLPNNPLDPPADSSANPNEAGANSGAGPTKSESPAQASVSTNGFLLIATIVSTVGCVFFVILAFDYYQRWMQSLTAQNDRFSLGMGEDGGHFSVVSGMECYAGVDDMLASRYNETEY